MDFFLFSISTGTFGSVFFAVFLAIAIRRPDIRSAGYMALAFFFGLLSLVFHEFAGTIDRLGAEFVDEASLWTGCLFMTLAIGYKAGWRASRRLTAAIFGCGIVALYLGDGFWDLLVMDIVSMLIFAMPLPLMAQNRSGPVQNVSFWFLVATIATVGIRALLAISDYHPAMFADADDFHLAATILSSAMTGIMAGNIICFTIATDLIQHHASAAMMDPLTGLMNRRGMAQVVAEMEQEAGAPSTEGRAILIFDIDHFKQVNDRFGHDAGDDVLVKISNTVADLMKYHGHCARTGGEEFSVLFSQESSTAAFLVAEHLRVAIGLLTHEALPQGEKITVSMGLAFVREGEAMKRAVRRADAALYAAKDAGRNRLRLADGDVLPDVDEGFDLPQARVQPHDLQRRSQQLRAI